MENKSWFQLQSLYKYLKIQTENKKFLSYLEISATFLLIIVFLIFAVFPTITTISKLLGDIKTKEATIVKMNTKISNVLQAQESFANVQDKYDLIESSFPSNPNYYKSASSLSSSLKDNSVKITRLSFDIDSDTTLNKKNLNKDKTYVLSLNGAGQYSDILKMVKQFLNNRRLVDLTKIQISKNDTDNSNLNVNLISDLHYLPIEK